ncbi:glycoside hydrolase [Opitutaceae bacterium EW11]|nr:glycoside hydrolase [Opitutaceae bacterium EW11]
MKIPRIPYLRLAALALLFSAANAAPTGLDSAGQLAVAPELSRGEANSFAFVKLENGIQLRARGLVKNILFYSPGIVRVTATPGPVFTQQPSFTVVLKPASLRFSVKETPEQVELSTEALRVLVAKPTGALTFQRADGTVLTREKPELPAEIKQVTLVGAPSYEVKQSFKLADDESLYGLGQYRRAYMDYRGEEVLLSQSNIGICVPFLLSTRRYGVLWDVYSKSLFRDDASGMSLWAESAPAGVDYYLLAGDTMDGVIAAYRNLTGAAPMYARSAFGLWMSKERYQTQDRLIEVVKNFRKDGFPLDNIVQDWQYWGGNDGTWSGMTWDKTRYPDPVGMARTLHDSLHVKLMCSIWPTVGNDTELAHELDAKGFRHEPLHWISKKARVYDAYSPEARAIYFKYIKKGLFDVGVDALWMDGTEVESLNACSSEAETEKGIKILGKNAAGDYTRYYNTYSLLTTKGVYEGQRATSDKRVLTLTRSAFTGQQRYAALPWSGDTSASYKTLAEQISGGLNVGMAGLPYWTQDTGGFFVDIPGGERNPGYQELYARWNQFAIFNPLYRIHGTSIEREPYIFRTLAPETYASLRSAADLRYRLLPYIYSLAWQSTANGYTMMRGLVLDFPDDPKVRKLQEQFLFGPAFLVHPVTRAIYHPISEAPQDVVPEELWHTTDGKPGLKVDYYSGRNFEKLVGTRIEPKVDQSWSEIHEPPPGLDGYENFSAKWEGVLTIPETGEYEIGAEADDGVRLWLGGELIAEDWSDHAPRFAGKRVKLEKGRQVPVKIEYYQGAAGRSLRMVWNTPSALAKKANPAIDKDVATYLPIADWYDFWTNERVKGGRDVVKSCALADFPLYVRAGSIVPMGPAMNYATEKLDAPLEIRVYPGANAKFVLYEDDNETYAYEKGQYATVELSWNDAARTLTIGDRRGSFPQLVKERELRIVVAGPGKGVGPTESKSVDQVVKYTGAKRVVKL